MTRPAHPTRALSSGPQPVALLTARAPSLRVFSYGGGVQSNAVLVLQATGRLRNPYDVFVFANVGADSENPATLEYVENVAKPYAAKHGIAFVEVQKTTYGEPETLKHYIERTPKSVPIPVYFPESGIGRRSCTQDFKIAVIDKYIKSTEAQYVTTGLGISLDEYQRMRDTHWHDHNGKKKLGFWKRREFPLIDLRLSRADCHQIILDAGLPLAPKSSCYFCPFKKHNEWVELKLVDPPLFWEAVGVEHTINDKGTFGDKYVSLHGSRLPLEQAVGNQLMLFPDWMFDSCDEGVCHV